MAIRRSDTRLTDEIIRENVSKGYWNVPTYPDILQRNARERGGDIAIVDDRREITWAGLLAEARSLAAHLIKSGVSPGDVVGLQLPNRIEFVAGLAAINMVGAVACPYLVNLRATEVRFILGFSAAVTTIVAGGLHKGFDLVAMMSDLRKDLPLLREIIVVGGADVSADVSSYAAVIEANRQMPGLDEALASRAPAANDISRILLTSGSTGEPKGVIHTHATTIYSNLRQNEYMGVDGRSVMLVFVPVALNLGMFQVIQAALAPCPLVLLETFTPERAIELIERWRVTCFVSPPTGLAAILGSSVFSRERLKSLEFVISGGTPCAVDLQRRLRDGLGCAILDGYGMTEAGWISATTLTDRPEDTEGTVGYPFPWMQVRVCDEHGQVVPQGVAGEISVAGPCICVGYYNAPQRNAEAWFADGRFRTGDLGYIDQCGRLRLTGRIKDLIKHGGISIYPRDLEELLVAHPKIAEVAVIGVPDPHFGENACACVVPRHGETLTLEEIIAFLRDRIATFKLPQRLEIFDRLPYTATGKIQKHLLRQAVEVRLAGRAPAEG